MMDIDYDKMGVIEVNDKTITRLFESRKDWRVTCDCCRALIAASNRGIAVYDKDELASKVATTGILWCHHWKQDKVYKTIYEQVFAMLDHPSLCVDCLEAFKKLGWEFCDCGCGG